MLTSAVLQSILKGPLLSLNQLSSCNCNFKHGNNYLKTESTFLRSMIDTYLLIFKILCQLSFHGQEFLNIDIDP